MNSPEACATVLLFPNLDGLNPTTLVPCDSTLYTATIYRATTYSSRASVMPAATGSLPSQTASASSSSSSLQSSSTESSNNRLEDIGLGVGLGVGLPTFLLAIAALWVSLRNRHYKDSAAALDPNRSNQSPGQPEREVAWNKTTENQVVSNAPLGFRTANVHEIDSNPRAELTGSIETRS